MADVAKSEFKSGGFGDYPEELSRRNTQNLHWRFFRPDKVAETNVKFLWSKFCSTKSQNAINFLVALSYVLEQSNNIFFGGCAKSEFKSGGFGDLAGEIRKKQ